MRIRFRIALPAAAVALMLVQGSGYAALRAAPGRALQDEGIATGSLTVGESAFRLAHAHAFPDAANPDAAKATCRVLITDRPLPAEAQAAASAGATDEGRQQLALAFVEHEISGLEMIVAGDTGVVRMNVYSPDSPMGLMLLDTGGFEASALDSKTIAGKVFTRSPIQDPRIRKTVQYKATFSTPVHQPVAK